MKQKIKLGILDQSIVRQGSSPKDAIEETIATAKLAEELGYSRFWVSEHHNAPSIAGSTPEVLMVKLADVTKKIRIGSGGVMLPNHSALKVAENFRMLEALFPGRIDLGMGRAPGSDRITAAILNPSNDLMKIVTWRNYRIFSIFLMILRVPVMESFLQCHRLKRYHSNGS